MAPWCIAAGVVPVMIDPLTQSLFFVLGDEPHRRHRHEQCWSELGGRRHEDTDAEAVAARECHEESGACLPRMDTELREGRYQFRFSVPVPPPQLYPSRRPLFTSPYYKSLRRQRRARFAPPAPPSPSSSSLATTTTTTTTPSHYERVFFFHEVPWKPTLPAIYARTRAVFKPLETACRHLRSVGRQLRRQFGASIPIVDDRYQPPRSKTHMVVRDIELAFSAEADGGATSPANVMVIVRGRLMLGGEVSVCIPLPAPAYLRYLLAYATVRAIVIPPDLATHPALEHPQNSVPFVNNDYFEKTSLRLWSVKAVVDVLLNTTAYFRPSLLHAFNAYFEHLHAVHASAYTHVALTSV